MFEVENILKTLSGLDLSRYPIKEIVYLLRKIGNVGMVRTTLHPGATIIRARPNYNGERFSKISQLSYKPAEFNTTFQRASTPKNTMFYGGLISGNRGPSELSINRIIGLFESLSLMRDLESSGEHIITYSKWTVTKDIPLASIIYHKEFPRENAYASEQRFYFEKFLRKLAPSIANKSTLVTNFLANEFAKKSTQDEYNYLISALFTELVVSKGSAGVFYPSVRTGGEGFNVAIHPYYVHNHMTPIYAGECTIYKRQANTIVDNDTGALLLDGYSDFELKPVISELHTGKDIIMRALYPERYLS